MLVSGKVWNEIKDWRIQVVLDAFLQRRDVGVQFTRIVSRGSLEIANMCSTRVLRGSLFANALPLRFQLLKALLDVRGLECFV